MLKLYFLQHLICNRHGGFNSIVLHAQFKWCCKRQNRNAGILFDNMKKQPAVKESQQSRKRERETEKKWAGQDDTCAIKRPEVCEYVGEENEKAS